MILSPRKCEHCRKVFQPVVPKHRFCSTYCRTAASHGDPLKKTGVPCANKDCGALFDQVRPWQKFCCPECKWVVNNPRRARKKRVDFS